MDTAACRNQRQKHPAVAPSRRSRINKCRHGVCASSALFWATLSARRDIAQAFFSVPVCFLFFAASRTTQRLPTCFGPLCWEPMVMRGAQRYVKARRSVRCLRICLLFVRSNAAFASSHPLGSDHSREEMCSLDRLPETCVPPGRTGGCSRGKPTADPLKPAGRPMPQEDEDQPMVRPANPHSSGRGAGARWLWCQHAITVVRESQIPRAIVGTEQQI